MNISIKTKLQLKQIMELHFKQNSFVEIGPLVLDASSREGFLFLSGRQPNKGHRIAIDSCRSGNRSDSGNSTECQTMLEDFFLEVTVIKSSLVAALVMIVGWAYFTAWSVSFYPQILLNFQRKSVIGLNFDFTVFNIVGFLAYSAYNVFMYFDSNVQAQYEQAHPHSPIPVLLNDVFFPTHAFLACSFTAFQCFIYERGNQRISYTCATITVVMAIGSLIAGIATAFDFINMLQFVTSLSYIKMAVTLFKYIPQAILNFRRKSTVGWSIGNVLLDFTGGCLDILQMCLQCWNVADFTAFYGNPVKFGLGLVSSLFDILFIIQHYVLYPHRKDKDRDDVEQEEQLMMDGEIEEADDKEGEKKDDKDDSRRKEEQKQGGKLKDEENEERDEEQDTNTKKSGNEKHSSRRDSEK
ncbi:hypothetical protein RB195_010078 [Necator americanus]